MLWSNRPWVPAALLVTTVLAATIAAPLAAQEVRLLAGTYSIKAEPSSVLVGEPVQFTLTAGGLPRRPEYRFHFGDETSTDWIGESTTPHSYQRAGTYSVYVEVRGRRGVVRRTRPVVAVVLPRGAEVVVGDGGAIGVQPPPPPPPERPAPRPPAGQRPVQPPGGQRSVTPPPPDGGGRSAWIVAGAALAVLFIAGLVLFLRVGRGLSRARPLGSELVVRPQPDPGTATFPSSRTPAVDLEVRLQPTKDPGRHRIEAAGDLISQERRDDDRA